VNVPTKITLRVLSDVDEASGAGELRPEPANVDVTFAVAFGEAEHREVEATAVIEIELLVHVDDGVGVDYGTEVEPALRNAADDSGFGGQGHVPEDLLLVGDRGHPFRHADSEIDYRIGKQFERGAARNDLPLVERHGLEHVEWHADLGREGRVVLRAESLPVIFRFGDDQTMHEKAGNLHVLRIERTAFGNAFYLDDDEPTGILRRHGDREHVLGQRLALHQDVPLGIGSGSAQECHGNWRGPVEQQLLAGYRHDLNEIVLRASVDLAAFKAGISERADADPGHRSRKTLCHIAVEMRDHAEREIIGLDLIVQRQLADLRNEPPVAADGALD
jgi:hypothetical protein